MRDFVLFLSCTIWLFSCNEIQSEKMNDNEFYTCSMDPQVMEKKPGKCPICKMNLTKVFVNKNKNEIGISLSKEQLQLGNIQTMIVKDTAIFGTKILNGKLVVDENRISSINSRVGGRIEKLYIKNPGESITVGMKLYDIYSEELISAQKEYLMTLEKVYKFPDATLDYNALLEGLKNKLILWGLTEFQIKNLGKINATYDHLFSIYSKQEGIISNVAVTEGDYVMEGAMIFEISDLKNIWVEAQLYPAEIGELKGGDPVEIRMDAFPDKIFKSNINFATPQLQAQSKVNIVRAEIPNLNNSLKPGMHAVVSLNNKARGSIAIPIVAVIQDSQGAIVWIKNKNGKFENRKVVTGIESNDLIEIRSGIFAGDEVVVSGVYLLNSEYYFKNGSQIISDHEMSIK